MPARPLALVVNVETHWGLSLNYFSLTKSSPALRIIPPTTLIGALAYPIAKLMKWPENKGLRSSAEIIRKGFLGVYYSVIHGTFIPYSEISKLVSYKVREKGIIRDAAAVQRMYSSPGTRLRLYYMCGDLAGILGQAWEKILLEAAWSMSRIGAKESIVSVLDASLVEAEVVETSTIETGATVPMESVEEVEGEHVLAWVIDWRKTEIGKYHGSPMTLVAQPMGLLGRPARLRARLRKPLAYVVKGEELVPWATNRD